MDIEEMAFKNRRTLAQLNSIDLIDIILFLQNDRKDWVNQFTKTHNESVEILEKNKQLKKQQEKFIKYLEEEKDNFVRGCSHVYEDSLGKTRLVNEDIFDEIDNILQKYKEIIGSENK